jgi:hypothetical protein
MRGKAGIPLLNQLRIIDSDVKTEFQFDWLFLPKSTERTNQENEILNSLWIDCQKRETTKFKNKFCDFKEIYTDDEKIKGVARRLEYDFFLPKYNLLVELDENQHFTNERAITFQHYENKNFLYDIAEWKSRCITLNKKDSDPLTRDWKRAFRDAVRDLRARGNDFPLIRLYVSEVNEKALSIEKNCQILKALIEQKASAKYNK